MQYFALRFLVFGIVIVLTPIFFILAAVSSNVWWVFAIITLALSLVGIWDLIQPNHSVRRNYPVIGNLRFIFEAIRPEIRQYFIESDEDNLPFSREERSIVYQRAKQQIDKRPFGTIENVYRDGYEWIGHSMVPSKIEDYDFRRRIGSKACTQPYDCSIFNISAMSFGALSANAVLSLNKGAQLGGFAHDTGEGGISRYHIKHGGDLIWNIGSGYFGCRDAEGNFSPEEFAKRATMPQVKMIEIKLSQGAKPGHGGVLPGPKVTPEIAEARGIQVGQECDSPNSHSAFSTPVGLLEFVQQLRQLSGGKPVGFKLCIGHVWEWFSIAKAMVKTGIVPDFITVDGAEGGTGAAPVEFCDHVGLPMKEALRLVHNTLKGIGLRDQVKIAAAGKIVTGFDVLKTLALGADWCNSARGFMFSLGCIQAQKCHTNTCPTGIATQDPMRQKALVVEDKSWRVKNFHHNTLLAFGELLAATGLERPDQLQAHHVVSRVSSNEIKLWSALYPEVEEGALLRGEYKLRIFEVAWPLATPDSFKPQNTTEAVEKKVNQAYNDSSSEQDHDQD
ncbi:FMN-binding glutamate synthase family protein [Brackiella oedipodis]|uniref:FMN-binding glutamate synthase family protein n=1 Tax=Brackiella oedipodis TaxID=124225 RepID=UPI000570B4AB|nr:FMN-binding glutamate synthase family protein [Brackiella oedipodis]